MKKPLHSFLTTLLLVFIGALPPAFATAANNFSGCCKPPADLIYWCSDLPYGFNPRNLYQLQSIFGVPQNKCYPGLWEEMAPTIDLSNCETGTLIRHFKVSAHYGYEYCDQKIIIKGVHNYDIRFPADVQASCGEKPPVEELFTSESDCDLLAVSVEDYNFIVSGSSCGKIFRKYKVINWCEYDGISDRVVIDRDEDCDGLPGDEAVWVLRRSDGFAFIDRDNDAWNNNPKAGERSTCTPTNPTGYWRKVRSTGYWEYTQHIKIGDGEAPVITLAQPSPICSYVNTCNTTVHIPFSVSDVCTPDDIKIKVFIDGIKIAEHSKGGNYKATGLYKLGDHALEIHATDGCGNSTVQKKTFKIVDCKAPALICINGIAVRLMRTPPNTDVDGDGDIDRGAMTIWATDLLTNSQITDCSGVAGFSISRVGERPDSTKKSLTLTCDDEGTVYVRVYAWDNANNPYALQPDSTRGGNNYGFCQTYILVQSNPTLCTPPPSAAPTVGSIVGTIKTEDEYGLEAVQITLVGSDSSLQWTSNQGNYTFDSLRVGNRYKIIPSLNSDYLEGLAVSDLVALQDHILGNRPITSAYKLIAADANRSGEITTTDVIELRRLLLGLSYRLTNNTSWRFVPADFKFPNLTNPWQTTFPEFIQIDSVNAKNANRDFIATKIGDIDGSVGDERRAIQARSASVNGLLTEEQEIRAGTTIEVPLQLTNAQARAAQFALYFDPTIIAMTDIKYETAQAQHLNTQNAANGEIRVVWTAGAAASNNLFTMQFHVLQTARLSEVLQMDDRILPAKVLLKNDELARLTLQFTPAKTSEFALYQNVPNPFQEETVIAFQLPEATTATLKIHDLTGKVLWQQKSYLTQGRQEIRIARNALPAEGLLLYTLETPQHRATKKMVVLPR